MVEGILLLALGVMGLCIGHVLVFFERRELESRGIINETNINWNCRQ